MRIRRPWVIIVGGAATLLIAGFAIGFREFERGLNAYCGVPIRRNRDETLYRLGYPPFVLGPIESAAKAFGDEKYKGFAQSIYSTDEKAQGPNAMPVGKHVENFDYWVYGVQGNSDAATIGVEFDHSTNEVLEMSCIQQSRDQLSDTTAIRCPPLLGVSIGLTEEAVVKRLGRHYKFKLDGVSKTILYDDLGVEILLTKNQVYGLRLSRSRGTTLELVRRYARTWLPRF